MTCNRRGYELIDIGVWQIWDSEKRDPQGYVDQNALPYTPCDPPRYTDLGVGEHPRILPEGAVVINQKQSSIMNIDIVSQVQALVNENIRLKKDLAERPTVSAQPTINFVKKYRLELCWYGSWGDIYTEWGFDSRTAAEDRFQVWIDTFGDKFEKVKISEYLISET